MVLVDVSLCLCFVGYFRFEKNVWVILMTYYIFKYSRGYPKLGTQRKKLVKRNMNKIWCIFWATMPTMSGWWDADLKPCLIIVKPAEVPTTAKTKHQVPLRGVKVLLNNHNPLLIVNQGVKGATCQSYSFASLRTGGIGRNCHCTQTQTTFTNTGYVRCMSYRIAAGVATVFYSLGHLAMAQIPVNIQKTFEKDYLRAVNIPKRTLGFDPHPLEFSIVPPCAASTLRLVTSWKQVVRHEDSRI